MMVGFAAALCGDWMLAVKGSPPGSGGFFAGVVAFTLAHILWMAAHLGEAHPDMRAFVLACIPLSLFVWGRLPLVLPPATWCAVAVYAAATALDFAMAVATRRRFYVWGVALLAFSDVMIGFRLLGVPGCGCLIGPAYVAAELCLIASCFLRSERRICWASVRVGGVAVWIASLSLVAFTCAMATYPGGGYNPIMQMLSALGRSKVKMVDYPLCHFLFLLGMFISAVGIARIAAGVRSLDGFGGTAATAFRWGAALNAAGLASIALVPENANMFFHNAGCWLAAAGGAVMLFSARRGRADAAWRVALMCVVAVFGSCLALNAFGALPFSPWVTSTQKLLILSFMAWVVWFARPAWSRMHVRIASAIALAAASCAVIIAWNGCSNAPPRFPSVPERAAAAHVPFSDDERAALRWLEHVTGWLSPEEERDWWNVGGGQTGLFSKRYNIAFCGYAAIALGMRGGEAERSVAVRILGNCIARYLKRDVWAYFMDRSYWGRKPWAPDPCFRENVMYTGHLLQLLAFYELLSGDARYWKEGFDFIWRDGRRVHYTVKRLIDVTVHQMRKGPNGGVCCEPGLMFFPCNNHPHIALAIFGRLGHGDWKKDARRWERWALSNYLDPLFGGGALNLMYHVSSGIMVPRGHSGLDGWSLLWYEPWAQDRGAAVALWRKAAGRIRWKELEDARDAIRGEETCCEQVDVPPVATMSFLAAAARACDDSDAAERLERLIDRSLVRRGGLYFLDVGREWRIGATANRIISLAESNGFRFRDLLS